MPFDGHEDGLERQAALVVDLGLIALGRDPRVDDGDRRVGIDRAEDEQAAEDADLRGREAGAAGVVHQLGHPVDESAEIVVEVLDVVRFQAQNRIRVLPDLREREAPSGNGFRIGLVLARRRYVAAVLGCPGVDEPAGRSRRARRQCTHRLRANPSSRNPAGRRRRQPSSLRRALPERRGREQLPKASCDKPWRIRLRDQLGPVATPEPRQRCRPEHRSRAPGREAPRARATWKSTSGR